MNNESVIQDRFAALKQDYTNHLPDKLLSIESAWRQYLNSKDDELLSILQADLHKLAGSGATFGFPNISKIAKILELFVKDNIVQATIISEENIKQFSALLMSLKQATQTPHHK